MPSAFETRFSTARTQLVRVHGQAIPFTESGTASAVSPTTTIIVSAEMDELREDLDGSGVGTPYLQRFLQIQNDEVANYGRGCKAVIDGETWTVHETIAVEEGLTKVIALCPQRTDRAGRRHAR